MRARHLLPLAAAAVSLTALLTPAVAAPKTITKSYALTLLPFPSPPQGFPTCLPAEGVEGTTKHTEILKAPAPGVLKVEVTGFNGDWDVSVFDDKGVGLASGAGTTTGDVPPAMNGKDTLTLKVKKARTLQVVTCNFAGTPQGSGKYTFTY